MDCLSNICYVCLEKKDKLLININSSLSVNQDIIHIIGYPPFNLAWLKTKQIILICEECCLRLRETYHFLAKCHKNSSLLQGYMNKLNIIPALISNTDKEVELRAYLNNKQDNINKIKGEIKLENEEIYTFESRPIIEETEDESVNIDDSFVKEEDNWKREEVADDKDESPMDNNSTESNSNLTDSEIFVNSNTHVTDIHSDSSTFTFTTNKKDLNTGAKESIKCLTCSKSFSTRTQLQIHTRVHTLEKPYKCAICEKCFSQRVILTTHMRIHTGEKPYKCAICGKSFKQKVNLVRHMVSHSGEKAYKCIICENRFTRQWHVVRHMRIHTGNKAVA